MKLKYIPIIAVALLMLGGCTVAEVVTSPITSRVAGVIAKPIFGLAVKDARTTLTWIEREVAAGRLAERLAPLAQQCPNAVIALDEMRAKLAGEGVEELEGFKGLIYFGTIGRFGQSPQDDLAMRFEELASSCSVSVPITPCADAPPDM